MSPLPCSSRLILLLLGLVSTSARAESPSEDDRIASFLSSRIEPKLKSKDYVGVVVGVIDGKGGAPRVYGFGTTEVGKSTKPDGRTMFEIGSITKVFTGIVLAESVVTGRARLDEPMEDLLPAGLKIPSRDGVKITLEHLATHYSGLPRIPGNVTLRAVAGQDPYADVFEKGVFDALEKWKPTNTAGTTHAYSNWGAAMLGLAIAHRSHTTYEQCVRRVILDALHLSDTTFEMSEEQKTRWAKPYVKGGKPGKSWHFDAMAGCGGLKSNVDDMLRFLTSNLESEHVAPPLGDALRLAIAPRRASVGAKSKIGLGWIITERSRADTPVIWHNGGTGGYRSFAGFQPKTRRAVVVLGNTDVSVDDLAFSLFDELDRATKSPAVEKP